MIRQGCGECPSFRRLVGQPNNWFFGGSQLHWSAKGDRWNNVACPFFVAGCELNRHRNDAAIVRAEGQSIADPDRSSNGGNANLG